MTSCSQMGGTCPQTHIHRSDFISRAQLGCTRLKIVANLRCRQIRGEFLLAPHPILDPLERIFEGRLYLPGLWFQLLPAKLSNATEHSSERFTCQAIKHRIVPKTDSRLVSKRMTRLEEKHSYIKFCSIGITWSNKVEIRIRWPVVSSLRRK